VSGWYRDPSGRYELRFHNGQMWTADVATGGRRFVDHLPVEPPRRRGNGLAVAAMVCGITGLTIAWIPFIGVVGVASAVVGVVLGIIALRRSTESRRAPAGGSDRRGFAMTGVITGGLGILAGGLGVWFSVVLYRAIDEFQHPGPNDAELAPCVTDSDGLVTIDGSVRNLSDDEQSYSVRIEITDRSRDRRQRISLDDVPPGETREFHSTERVTAGSDASCRIVSVDGPLPFGIEIDSNRSDD
jgi:hypothetical protein